MLLLLVHDQSIHPTHAPFMPHVCHVCATYSSHVEDLNHLPKVQMGQNSLSSHKDALFLANFHKPSFTRELRAGSIFAPARFLSHLSIVHCVDIWSCVSDILGLGTRAKFNCVGDALCFWAIKRYNKCA